MSTPGKPHHPHVAETLEQLKEHTETTHVWLADRLDSLIRHIGHGVAWLNGLLVLVIITQVVLRYGFNSGLVPLEELQWHIYATAMMFGISYAVVSDSHIRVDVLHNLYSDRAKRIIEIIGILLFLLPFAWVVFHHSLDFVYDSWRVSETSDAPTGLPYRWAIKSVISISFGLLLLAAFSRLVRDVTLLLRKGEK
uniref:TRAP transporter small permease protein n=1 Tax=Magnetococcus massalia (strain MO-1) TaxID=451514 RepID=A0A1S7LDC3_MAGMO|nr:Putative C4-dicarboxylate transporter family protein, DctQ subunit [Candidatus Magnetococcus massalia]